MGTKTVTRKEFVDNFRANNPEQQPEKSRDKKYPDRKKNV